MIKYKIIFCKLIEMVVPKGKSNGFSMKDIWTQSFSYVLTMQQRFTFTT